LIAALAAAAAAPASAQDRQAPASEPTLITRDPASLTFQRNYWDPSERAKLLALEFLKSDWEKRIKLEPPPSGKAVAEEIAYLHRVSALRAERQAEINKQIESVVPYFFPAVMMHQYSHPRTYELLAVPAALDHVVFHFKQQFNRPRPSQLSPALGPIILVPGHPAYPSGHAFHGWFMGRVMADVRPDARAEIMAMAHRIGFNREVAGVHYPSDTAAGQKLADQVFELIKQQKLFGEVLAEAKAEWR
jgi:acid phosphatase (class A)